MPDKTALKTTLIAGLVAGTLDLSAALFVYTVLIPVTTATRLLQSIASGVLARRRLTAGRRRRLAEFCFITSSLFLGRRLTFWHTGLCLFCEGIKF